MPYQIPQVLQERYLSYFERWGAREQFAEILELMQMNKTKLETALKSGSTQRAAIKALLLDIEAFKVWSWGESDRDEYFFEKIVEFDRRTYELTQ